MKHIKDFLIKEQTEGEGQKLKHIEHLEDLPLNTGSHGFEQALGALNQTKTHIQMGKKDSNLTMKHDGSPSIVYGYHPDNGKFFVASKSAFNKSPKINYSHEDIEKNHGHAPGLVQKLKDALTHLPKISPKKGVFQGDVLYSGDDVKSEKGKVHFKPNTITYSAKENSPEGKKIKNSKFGLYTHTEYKGNDSASMNANFNPNLSGFKSHPDVHHREPGHDTSKVKLTDDDHNLHNHHVQKAMDIHNKFGSQMYAPLEKNRDHVKAYINKTIRTDEDPSHEGLKHHMTQHYGKLIDKVSTPAAKNRKAQELKDHLTHIESNKNHYNNVFKLHGHLQSAKNVLVTALSRHTGDLDHHISGQSVKPEGFVVNHQGSAIKLNDRKEFNKLNFLARK
jgi:hypothetical protein